MADSAEALNQEACEISALWEALATRGVQLRIGLDRKLRAVGPAGAITPALREQIGRYRGHMLAELLFCETLEWEGESWPDVSHRQRLEAEAPPDIAARRRAAWVKARSHLADGDVDGETAALLAYRTAVQSAARVLGLPVAKFPDHPPEYPAPKHPNPHPTKES